MAIMTQRRPLVEALIEFQQKNPISFHVPGHKNGELSGLPAAMRQALAFDLTELTGLDDLHYPEQAIGEAQRLLAETYGAQQSFFLECLFTQNWIHDMKLRWHALWQ